MGNGKAGTSLCAAAQGTWLWRCLKRLCSMWGAEPWQPHSHSGEAALCAVGSGATRARSCSGGCSESREGGRNPGQNRVCFPAVTPLIGSAAGLCSHGSVGWHPPGGCSSHPMASVGWRPKVLCPQWSLAEDLPALFLWGWAPWGALRARAAEEESLARP